MKGMWISSFKEIDLEMRSLSLITAFEYAHDLPKLVGLPIQEQSDTDYLLSYPFRCTIFCFKQSRVLFLSFMPK